MNHVDLVEVRSGRFCPIAQTFCCCPLCSDEYSLLRVSPRTSKGQICCRGFFSGFKGKLCQPPSPQTC